MTNDVEAVSDVSVTSAAGGTRWWQGRPWLSSAALPVTLAVATVVLFLCYLQVSRTQRGEADGASISLQAWDMLHGNLLLHGWTGADVSFYTTELPEYMLVEAVRGLNADVVHVAAALTYALLVLFAALLARGRATGREGLLRMLIAAGILLAPEPGPGVFIVLFQPDHIGTGVPLLVAWLVLDRMPRRWYLPVVMGVLLTWIGVADGVILFTGAAPLALVCGFRAFQRIVRRHEPARSAWLELSLAAAAVISVPASDIIVRLISTFGGYTMLPLSTQMTTLSGVLPHVRLATDGVLGMYGASFQGHPTGVVAFFAGLHLVGIVLAGWALWHVARRFFGCEDLIAQLLAVGIVVNLAAYLVSAKPAGYWSTREFAAILPMGAVLAGRVLAGPLLARRAAAAEPAEPGDPEQASSPGRVRTLAVTAALPVLGLVLAGYVAALAYAVTLPSVPSATQDLADWLLAHHATDGLTSFGLSTYQESNITTQSAGGVAGLRPMVAAGGGLSPGDHEYKTAWYDPRTEDMNFVVLSTEDTSLAEGTVQSAFGAPARVIHLGQYTIMVWNKNLLAELGPPAPQ
jgi:hypothetical protein